MPNSLTTRSARFKELDAIVDKSMPALAEIQKQELWRDGGFKTWAAYCESKGKSYQTIWRAIKLEEIQKTIPEVKTAQVAVEVSKIALPQRRKVVEAALRAADGKLTVPAIQNALAKRPERKKEVSTPVRHVDTPKDGTRLEIPPEILTFWNRNEEVNHLLSMVSKIRVTLEKAQDTGDKLYKGVDLQGCISKLLSLKEELECAKSYAVCPSCNGILFEDCEACRGRGALSKFHWNLVPEQIRKLRDA